MLYKVIFPVHYSELAAIMLDSMLVPSFLHKKGTAAPENLGDMRSSRKKAILHVIENSIWHIIVFVDNAQWPGWKGFHLRFSLFAYELALFKVREENGTLKNPFQLSWHNPLGRLCKYPLPIYLTI